MLYRLCTECGFELDDIATVMSGLHQRWAAGEGAIDTGLAKPVLSGAQFKAVIDEVVGQDSATECGVDWSGWGVFQGLDSKSVIP